MSSTTSIIVAAVLIFVLPAITLMVVFCRAIRRSNGVQLHQSHNQDPR